MHTGGRTPGARAVARTVVWRSAAAPNLNGMALAVIWHYWLGVFLVVGGVLFVVGSIVGYLVKVTRLRYPSREQRH